MKLYFIIYFVDLISVFDVIAFDLIDWIFQQVE